MRTSLCFIALLVLVCSMGMSQTAFTAGNIVVLRMGNGAGPYSSSNAVYLDEYTAAGAFVRTHAMPTTGTPLYQNYSAEEGYLTRSVDGQYLTMVGYTVAAGSGSGFNGSTAVSNPRAIGLIKYDGTENVLIPAVTTPVATGVGKFTAGTSPAHSTIVMSAVTGTVAVGQYVYGNWVNLGATVESITGTAPNITITLSNSGGTTNTGNQNYLFMAAATPTYANTVSPGCAVTTNGTDFWLSSRESTLQYYNSTSGVLTNLVSGYTSTMARSLNIFDGQLYGSNDYGYKLESIGTGTLPTAATTTAALSYPTSPNSFAPGMPKGFVMVDASSTVAGSDILYVIQSVTGGGGGSTTNNAIIKYCKINGLWQVNGGYGAYTDNYMSLTAVVSGSQVTLYAVRKAGAQGPGGELVKIVDAGGYSGSMSGTETIMAAYNTGGNLGGAWRGVAMAPAYTAYTWNGSASANWGTLTNWTPAVVPGDGTDVVVPNISTVPSITTAPSSINSLTVQSSASLSIASGLQLNVLGMLSNNGSITGTGGLSLAGSAPQTISGVGNIAKLVINNSNGVTIASGNGNTQSITESLTLTSGTLTTNGNLTLKSTSSGTAALSPVTGGSISGNVTVQRYIPGGKRAFRFLGHPFSSTLNLSSLTDNILITGGASTGFTASGSNAPSAFWYNTAVGNEGQSNDVGWTAFTTADGSGTNNNWNQYEGIRVLVRGNIADGLSPTTSSAVTIDATGTLNTGTQAIPLTKGANSGYNFIANPFASAINLIAGANVTIGSNVNTNFYVWDMALGSKGGWDNRAFSSSYVLPSFSAFIVKTAAADNITITEAAKTTSASTGTLFGRATAAPEMFNLYVKGDGMSWDRMGIYYDAQSSKLADRNDGPKMYNSEVNLYSLAGTERLSIDSRPFAAGEIIPLGFTSIAQHSFTISVGDYNLSSDKEIWLHDKYNDNWTKMEDGAAYSFSTTSDAATQGESRLELVQKAMAPLPSNNSFTVKLSPNPATDKVGISFNNSKQQSTTIVLINAEGKKLKVIEAGNVQSGQVTIDVRGLAKGMYYISLNGKDAQKLIVE